MNVLIRSVLVDYLAVFLLSLAVLVALLLFVGASLDLPKDVGVTEIVLMLPYLLPEATRNAMQAAALFAACSVFGRLSAGNEILALSSLGVSPWSIIRPVVVLAVFMSLTCVWLYDIGESWGQRGIHQVVVNSAEAIAYRFLRTKHTFTRGHVTLNVKTVEGRKLMRPMLIIERPDQGEPITIAAEEAELMGRNRELSLVMRNGTASIGDKVTMAFPEAMEQVISLSEGGDSLPKWPPEYCTLADLRKDISQQAEALARLEQHPQETAPLWHTDPPREATQPMTHAELLDTEREHMHWLKAQVNRRWANGFFCLAFVMMGIPVSMRARSRDYLTSFFACFLPVVLLNHPLHNFCIKLAESGRAPPELPWVGDILLICFGAWLLIRALRRSRRKPVRGKRFSRAVDTMITLDINSNYCDRGGGIRTYHQAKIAWFNRYRGGRYYFVVPGPKFSVRRVGRRVARIEVFGLPIGSGYRVMLGYPRVARILRRIQPQLIEVGDPFFTGPFCVALRALGRISGRVTSFYHSDPVETWAVPWAKRGPLQAVRHWLAALAGWLFYRIQRRYDVTIVTSRAMQRHLAEQGVERLKRIPLGVDRVFFADESEPVIASGNGRTKTETAPRRRMLFVGRLIADKAADLLWEALPDILRSGDVDVTVLGSGPYEKKFAAARWPGYRHLEYVGGRQELAEIYRQHDILLAPGPYETFGLAVLEAMASGLVVVGPDRGGTAELLAEARSPFIFRAGDLADFVRVVQIAATADLAPHRRAAHATARRFGTWPEAIDRLMEFYGHPSTEPANSGQARPRQAA